MLPPSDRGHEPDFAWLMLGKPLDTAMFRGVQATVDLDDAQVAEVVVSANASVGSPSGAAAGSVSAPPAYPESSNGWTTIENRSEAS